MPSVIVACKDLMTSSRLVDDRHDVAWHRDAASVTDLVSGGGVQLVLVDLQSFPELPGELRALDAAAGAPVPAIVAFAPHVRTDLIEAARGSCDEVLPRGAVAKRFPALLDRYLDVS